MRRQRRHRRGPRRLQRRGEGVELLRRDPEVLRLAAHLVQRHQPVPPVERRVLHALRHHRPAGLLEPDDELGPPSRVRLGARPTAGGPPEHEVTDELEGVRRVLGQPRAGLLDGPLDHLDALGGRRLTRHDVRAVPVERDQQLDDAQPELTAGVVAQRDVLVADRREQVGEPVHLGVQAVLDDLALGLVDDGGELGGLAGELGEQVPERGRRGRVGEEAADAPAGRRSPSCRRTASRRAAARRPRGSSRRRPTTPPVASASRRR